MTPQDVEALLDRLAPAAPPEALEERTFRAADCRPASGRRAFGIAAVAASVVICFGVIWLIVAPPAPTASTGGPQQADVDALVRALGDDDIAVRDRSGRNALKRLRKDAAFLEAVKARLKQESDPEIRERLKGLIGEAEEPPYRVRPVEKAVMQFTNTGILCHAAFSANGLRLAAVFFDGSMVLWSIPAARELVRANIRRQGQLMNCDPKRLSFSLDGRQIVLTDSQQRVGIYDAETLKWKNTIDARKGTYSVDFPVALHPEGKTIAWAEGLTTVVIGSVDGTVIAQADLSARLPRREAQILVSSLQYSANGKQLLAAGGHLAFLLDARTLETVAVVEDYQRGMNGACFAGREGFIVTRNIMGQVSLWDLATRESVASAATGSGAGGTSYPMFHAAGPWIFMNGGDQAHHLLAVQPHRRELLLLRTLTNPGDKAFVSPDGTWLLLGNPQDYKKAALFRMEPE